MPAFSRGRNETSTPSIPLSDNSCCRAPGGIPVRRRAKLSDAAGAHCLALYRGCLKRHPRPLLLAATPAAINATLYEKLNFNFIRDIAPVASIIRTTYVMAVNPTVPAKTVPEFILYANANSGKISMASVGIGSGTHIAGELFKMMTGINMLHVPYRGGGPALTDLLGGQMQVMFVTPVSSIEYIKTGRLRALAVTAATRSDALPDIPAVGEFVPGYEASVWFGVGAPKATPAEIVEKLNKEINAGLADPKTKARLADLGGTPLVGSPADFGKLIADETEKWGKVVKFLGIKAD
jgi:tripartite-type tricarboxylate transporter receptor subunit TctC